MKKRTLTKLAMMSVVCSLLIGAQFPQSSDSSNDGNTSNPFSNSAQSLSEKLDVIKAHYEANQNEDYQKWSQLFSSDYKINHPIYGQVVPNPTSGQMDLAQYFKTSTSDRPNRKILIKNIFTNPNDSDMIAVHWVRSFSVKGGEQQENEGVSIFTFAPRSDKIQSITVIYDSLKTREALQKNRVS